jgi:hypothetical protein
MTQIQLSITILAPSALALITVLLSGTSANARTYIVYDPDRPQRSFLIDCETNPRGRSLIWIKQSCKILGPAQGVVNDYAHDWAVITLDERVGD